MRRRPNPRSRNTDVWTSHNAGAEYEDVKIEPNSIRHRVLRCWEFVTDGSTAPEMQDEFKAFGIDTMETARKRVSELDHWGLLKRTGVTRPNLRSKRKRPCHVYVITAKGERALRRLDLGKTWRWIDDPEGHTGVPKGDPDPPRRRFVPRHVAPPETPVPAQRRPNDRRRYIPRRFGSAWRSAGGDGG